MASVNRDRNGYRVRFYDKNGDRQQIRLPGLNKTKAKTVCIHIEELNSAQIAGLPVSPTTLVWVDKVGEVIHQKMVAAGLVEPRESESDRSVAEAIDHHVDRGRTKTGRPASAATVRRWKNLVEFFQERSIRSVTVEDAEKFRDWLGQKTVVSSGQSFTENNIRTIIASAKMFFNAAIRRKWITENPFVFEIAAIEANRSRSVYVARDVSLKILDACPDIQWQLMFAFWRFTSLRKMEVFDLRWEFVLWDELLMKVPSSKTAHHEGGDMRLVPIAEILPYLKQGLAEADSEEAFIISRYAKPLTNLDKPFKHIVKRAGVEAWPKPFQNLRASAETDWLDWVGPNGERNSAHVVASWVGHSIKVQNKHYAQVDRHHFAAFNNGIAKVAPKIRAQ